MLNGHKLTKPTDEPPLPHGVLLIPASTFSSTMASTMYGPYSPGRHLKTLSTIHETTLSGTNEKRAGLEFANTFGVKRGLTLGSSHFVWLRGSSPYLRSMIALLVIEGRYDYQ